MSRICDFDGKCWYKDKAHLVSAHINVSSKGKTVWTRRFDLCEEECLKKFEDHICDFFKLADVEDD